MEHGPGRGGPCQGGALDGVLLLSTALPVFMQPLGSAAVGRRVLPLAVQQRLVRRCLYLRLQCASLKARLLLLLLLACVLGQAEHVVFTRKLHVYARPPRRLLLLPGGGSS